jgi:hypothetical protein
VVTEEVDVIFKRVHVHIYTYKHNIHRPSAKQNLKSNEPFCCTIQLIQLSATEQGPLTSYQIHFCSRHMVALFNYQFVSKEGGITSAEPAHGFKKNPLNLHNLIHFVRSFYYCLRSRLDIRTSLNLDIYRHIVLQAAVLCANYITLCNLFAVCKCAF